MNGNYRYNMENAFGDLVTIHVTSAGPAYVEIPGYFEDDDPELKYFRDEDAAADWAYAQGYRE